MPRMHRKRCLGIVVLSWCAALLGCHRTHPGATAGDAPEVLVSQPLVKEVTDYEEFTGRLEPVATVEVRARVTGYLDRVLFREGAEVREGDPLFEIDPRTYDAELKRAEAALLQAESRLNRLQLEHQRAATLLASRAVRQEDLDKISNDRDDAEVGAKLAEAARDLARLNRSFTRVVAPVSGRVSRQLIDPGNLVKADETSLTTIVAVDPIYVYFDQDERTVLRIRRMALARNIKSPQETSVPVRMGLADEPGFPHEGRLNFIDNRLDAATGTLRLRAVFANRDGLLSPGLFARVRTPIGKPHPAVLISDQALGSEQGQKFVYVVNQQNEVEYRPVKAGAIQEGLRAIEEGLTPSDRVILSGPEYVRPGMRVEAKVAGANVATQVR